LLEFDPDASPEKRRTTFKSSLLESRHDKGDSMPSKKGDNIYAKLPTEKTESEASFSDYDNRIPVTPKKSN
jgi:hypothetical protein